LRLHFVIDHLLEFIAILETDESIVEDSEDFVTPEFDDLLFVLVVVLVRQEEALEYL